MTAWPSFFSSIAAVTPLIPAPTTITLDIVGPCHSDPAVAGEEAQVIYSITCQEIARDVSLLLNMTRNMQHAVSTKHLLLVLSRYSQRTFPFKQGRMGVIKAAVERVWCEIAQVFFAKLAQRLTQGLRLSHCRTCECVRVVFKTARPDVNDWRNPESYRPRQERKQQHRRNEICSGKSCLMREYGFQLRRGELCDQCVEQHDFSKTSKTGKEGVGVARAFTAVHHFDATRGKMGTLRQCK